MDKLDKPRFFTGIQATGVLTLGNYCGLIHHILKIQEDYEVIIMIADLHALTVPKKDFDYSQKSREMAALLYACGLNQNCKIFIQSQIKEHLELTWLLAPFVTISELNNMIQYKEKKKQQETGNLALLAYPVLMAADIFLYDADLIIVGQDQQQHTELAQQVAQKFNNFYNQNLLQVPKFEIPQLGAKIKDLKNPQRKMSKSENSYIGLLDEPAVVEKKIKTAQTDSEDKITYQPEQKPGISNLLTIYSLLKNQTIEVSVKELSACEPCSTDYSSQRYSQFKTKLINLLNQKLTLIQQKYHQLLPHIEKTLTQNSNYLRNLAEQKVEKIRKKLKLLY
ncbi:MAG: tryptophan--tRNA ligase [Candidatus Moeniiplasma glomeromycotorum]|nr:tryptophan--tRNA ligase [Candidatus Moeniiplasma glomeromycotorum]MCE8162476.1 tryptophan--tRNA ligase [Candidatus Moeniiplasma glomeromycotorum]MCE8166403.1 tryptophan--tRNA ligase [Candidatus Moeniiplasma glomeromycotorum]MCE8166888.1 tryptophan--tRNA ligase [Candidatus Moeniiplasma glomeromycotorum]